MLTTAASTGLSIGFSGANAAIDKMTAGLDKTISQVTMGFMQGTYNNLASSAIGSITYSSDGGFGFDSQGFGKSVTAGLAGSLVQATQTATSGLINIGIEGLIGNALGDTSKMSNFVGGLAGQGVNAALGGDFTLNVMNLGFLAGNEDSALDRILSSGLLEMHLGGEAGFGMNIGTGGVDASVGNLMAVGRGIATLCGSQLAGSKQKETGEFASAMRTWYSGTEEQRQAFDDALNNKLLLRKSAEADFQDADDATKRTLAQTVDNEDGTRTMNIGTAALELGSRMGLNVVFAHEAYRNGKDDGEEGQRAETNRAVEGHVDAALALIAGYGAGSVGGAFMVEAMVYDNARKKNDMATISKIQERYDSSADYWKLMEDGSLKYDGDGWLTDARGRPIFDENGDQIGASGVEGGLLKILGVDANDKEAVARVRQMMSDAGLQHSDGANPEDWQWRGTVNGQDITTLNMNRIIGFDLMVNPDHGYSYGNSMATAVFMKGFDESTDSFLLKGTDSLVPIYVMDRYFSFVKVKGDFYNKMQSLVGGETSISGGYQEYIYKEGKDGKKEIDTDYYKNYENKHYGIDLATGGKKLPIFAGISGTVIASVKDDKNYGNYVQMEYGYQFEGYTYNTGIIGEYVHLDKAPLVKNKQFITAQTQLGFMGNTGKSQGIHLHYSVFTIPGQSFAENVMANIFGGNYAKTAMTNKPPENKPSTKTVYDPTVFYNKTKDIYTRVVPN